MLEFSSSLYCITVNSTDQLCFAQMYYSISSITIVVLTHFVFSISSPIDDLNSPSLLSDDTPSSSSLFTDDDKFSTTTPITTTAETLPNSCAAVDAPDDLSVTQQDETNLFSRSPETGPACLPPVNIGAEALQLFKNPLDSLENSLLPLKGQHSDDPSFGYPGRLRPGERGNVNAEDMERQGWQDFAGEVQLDIPDSKDCRELTAARGDFKMELCCDNTYAGLPFNEALSNGYRQVDVGTRMNSDIAVIWDCFCKSFCPFFFKKKTPPLSGCFGIVLFFPPHNLSNAYLCSDPAVARPGYLCPAGYNYKRVCCSRYVSFFFSSASFPSLFRSKGRHFIDADIGSSKFNRIQLHRCD